MFDPQYVHVSPYYLLWKSLMASTLKIQPLLRIEYVVVFLK